MEIEGYDFGEMIVDGKVYHRDLIITPSRIIDNWWRVEGHRLTLDDLKDVMGEKFEVLVIGTGYSGLMRVDREVIEEFKRRGIEVIIKPTRDAVEEFNRLVKSGRKVVGAFHLTC